MLLGIGRYAEDSGAAKGLQLSLFDVSDPDHPKRIDNQIFGTMADTEVTSDHHAFLYWGPNRLAVIPASLWEKSESTPQEPWIGVVTVVVNQTDGFGRTIKITHSGRPTKNKIAYQGIRRSVVMGDSLLTISERGVLVSDIGTLADRDWVPLG